ncbi:helix-turn-helix transcriptional regulator [Streptomyces sp. NPDC054919]
MEDASPRGLTKVVRVLPPRLRARVDALRAMTVSGAASGPVVAAGVLTAVAQACRDEERLRFGYTSRGCAPTEREVEPHHVVALGGRWYLVAYDLDRHDWRSFRLHRLTGPTATGARFRPRLLPAEGAVAVVQAASGPRLRTWSRPSSTRHPHGCGRWSASGARSSRSTRTAAGSP